jgi:hypothetical protein
LIGKAKRLVSSRKKRAFFTLFKKLR